MGSRDQAVAEVRTRLVLDAGAIIAAARGDLRARRAIRRAAAAHRHIVVPAGVVAETVRGRGPRDAAVNQILKRADEIAPVTEEIARAAGALLSKTRSSSTMDALLVAEALASGPSIVLTADVDDIKRLVAGHRDVEVLRI